MPHRLHYVVHGTDKEQLGTCKILSSHGEISESQPTLNLTENLFSHPLADSLLENSTRLIVIDNNNDVWCGTYDGVNYYDGKIWQSFTPKDGLAGDQVMQIVNEKSGEIWFFSPFGGISRYTPTK